MAAPLSVVVPTLNAADRLGPTLGRLTPGLVEGMVRELILSDGGSRDAIAEVADGIGARLVAGPAGRGGQLRRGAEAARGEWLLFLHADTLLPEDWVGHVRRHMERGADQAGVFRLSFDDPSWAAAWVGGWANWRTRLFALPFGDQGLLISRRLYEAVGGYPDIPLMEDVEIARALGGARVRLLEARVTTSAERYRREGWLRRGWRNWRCLAMHRAGASPEKILELYSERNR